MIAADAPGAEVADADSFVRDLFEGVLRRAPRAAELQHWVDHVRAGRPPERVVRDFVASAEFRQSSRVRPAFPIGHYYSPVVDPGSLGAYVADNRRRAWAALPGIRLELDAMAALWTALLPALRSTSFPFLRSPSHRFCYDNHSFPIGDAAILRAMILQARPSRIIEIGCGDSSACMLDVADEMGPSAFQLTCIDPYPDRLKALLRPGDFVEIVARRVQDVALDRFEALGPGDILFIDSTHVLKTGSDVHYELFYILPALRPGVLVHFHDVQFPFEYPDAWVTDANYSWNEAYALQAFLMFNSRFSVRFWAAMLATLRRAVIEASYAAMLQNFGSGIWLDVH